MEFCFSVHVHSPEYVNIYNKMQFITVVDGFSFFFIFAAVAIAAKYYLFMYRSGFEKFDFVGLLVIYLFLSVGVLSVVLRMIRSIWKSLKNPMKPFDFQHMFAFKSQIKQNVNEKKSNNNEKTQRFDHILWSYIDWA